MPSSGLQNLPSGRLRTALGQILEALGRHLLHSPSEKGGILAQNIHPVLPKCEITSLLI